MVFVVGFVVTCETLHRFRPTAVQCSVPTYSPKCRRIKQLGEPIDIVVVGTSRMFNGVIPHELEAELQGQNISANVWNLSLHNLASFEQNRILKDVFGDMGIRPKLVIIEPCSRLGVGLGNATSTRRTYFLDAEGTAAAWRFTLASKRPSVRKAYNLACLIPNSLVGLMNYGLMAEQVFPGKAAIKSGLSNQPTFIETKGYESAGAETEGVIKVRADLAGAVERAEKQELVELKKTDGLPAGQIEELRSVFEWVERQGSKCVFVVMPKFTIPDGYYRRTEFQVSRSLKADPELSSIDYLSRTANPDLYKIPLWHDYNHLSDEGAKVFSRDLARRIAPMLVEAK